jgi:hypothetical protein
MLVSNLPIIHYQELTIAPAAVVPSIGAPQLQQSIVGVCWCIDGRATGWSRSMDIMAVLEIFLAPTRYVTSIENAP